MKILIVYYSEAYYVSVFFTIKLRVSVFFTKDSIKLLLSTHVKENVGTFQFTIQMFGGNNTASVFTTTININFVI